MIRLFLALLALASPALGVEIKETRWGFEGRVVASRFNLLSVRVAHAGPAPFEGELILRETRGGEQPVGAPLVQPLYLTPGAERWVQFTPFVAAEYDWLLRWGRKTNEGLTIPPAKFGAPATVLLVQPGPFNPAGQLRAFPDDLFPSTVSATDSLDMVALDHIPRWEASRREAFLDWVRRGGVVHLLRTGDGFPAFEGDLAPLNTTTPEERLGAGRIVRHEATRAGFNPEFLQNAGFPVRELKPPTEVNYYAFDNALLRGLASMTRPEIAWWLIYLLTLVYLGVIGPLHFRWAKRLDYGLSLGIVGGAVAVFSIAFLVAGKRGAGERQMTHSVGIAHALGGGRYDVTQWLSAFAVSGDTYKLTHPASSNLYSASSDVENVNGRIFNGRDGRFLVDLPLYSSRAFMHRAVMTAPEDVSVEVERWDEKAITLRTTKDFPPAEEIWARWNGQFRRMHFAANQIVLDTSGSWQPEPSFFTPGQMHALGALELNETKPDAKTLWRPLIARALGGIEGMLHYSPPRPLPKDQLQLFIYAPVPAAFRLQGKGFGREEGWVLYVQDIFKPEV